MFQDEVEKTVTQDIEATIGVEELQQSTIRRLKSKRVWLRGARDIAGESLRRVCTRPFSTGLRYRSSPKCLLSCAMARGGSAARA